MKEASKKKVKVSAGIIFRSKIDLVTGVGGGVIVKLGNAFFFSLFSPF